MRVQLENDTIRVRVDEDELDVLLQGGALSGSTAFGQVFTMRYAFDATPASVCGLSGDASAWRIGVPHADLEALKLSLPNKDGLFFEIPGHESVATTVRFDVDVKDSLRRRRG